MTPAPFRLNRGMHKNRRSHPSKVFKATRKTNSPKMIPARIVFRLHEVKNFLRRANGRLSFFACGFQVAYPAPALQARQTQTQARTLSGTAHGLPLKAPCSP